MTTKDMPDTHQTQGGIERTVGQRPSSRRSFDPATNAFVRSLFEYGRPLYPDWKFRYGPAREGLLHDKLASAILFYHDPAQT
jgi:hypothetical protein